MLSMESHAAVLTVSLQARFRLDVVALERFVCLSGHHRDP